MLRNEPWNKRESEGPWLRFEPSSADLAWLAQEGEPEDLSWPEADPVRPAVTRPMTIEQMRQAWIWIRRQVRAIDRRAGALLASAMPYAVRDDAVTVITSYDFHWEQLNEPANRQAIERVVSELFRCECRVV